MSELLNIVIPMAGLGSRFSNKGYDLPKPFIDVNGKMMIEQVLTNLSCKNARYILITREEFKKDHLDKIKYIENNYNVDFLYVDKLTDGAACTCLKAHTYINNDVPLMFANSDQIIDLDINTFIENAHNRNLDGSMITFSSNDTKWSYAKLDENGFVTNVQEKVVISNNATVGIYYYAKGKYFINAVLDMIANADKSKNEYYVAPTYNYCYRNNHKIGIFEIKENEMHGIGTPSDLENYLKGTL